MTTSKQKRHIYDVLVIGSGLAGLYYCLSLLKRSPNLNIALLSKDTLQECNSYYAQGGIACASNNPSHIQSHVDDTLLAGADLSNQQVTQYLLRQGHQIIDTLLSLGVEFDKENGSFHLAREGGHSKRRIFHCGDKTGHEIILALTEKVKDHPQITCLEHHTAINLIPPPSCNHKEDAPQVIGAYVLNETKQEVETFLAHITLLATGGSGKVYRYTTNPDVASGDGLAMAYRAGAVVSNLEFYQFHPTLLYHPTVNNFLISEAVRGEGAILRNCQHEAFMAKYAPHQKDLATRDVVARAIFNEIERSSHDHVYLDIRHQPKALLQKRFPQIFEKLMSVGIDMSQDLIPVVPAAHYMCGGIKANETGMTNVKRLFAIGEVACSGLHGANRLASNSLLEACAMAQNAAEQSLNDTKQPLCEINDIEDWSLGSKVDKRRASQINAHWRGLRGEMMSYAGIIRTQAGLADLLALIKTRRKIIDDYYWHHKITRDLIELRNIVCVAELIVQSALNREESRGGHYREDYPKTNTVPKDSYLSKTTSL